MNTQKLEQVPIDKLVPYARNARTHSKEQIAQLRASLREFGFVSPAVIDADYNILVGHGRIEAARAEGYETVPCVFAENLTEAQKRAYILADNQLALNAGWDEEMLSVELSDLQDSAFDLSLLGFGADELEKLLGGSEDKDIKDDDFDLSAALEKASFVEPGDIWTVGRHRLMCGDATSTDDVNALMEDKKANLILTDPPYGVSFKASDGLTIQNDSLKGEEFYNFLLSAFKNMADHLEKGGAAYCFHAGQHEPVLYGFLQNGKHPWYSDRKQTTIWNYDKPKRNKDHPTSKPLDLLGYPIQNSSQENAVVIDTFGGSGSTLMACEQLNRVCYMMELDPKYASVILRRYVEDTDDAENVYVIRNGERIDYSALVKQVDFETV